MTQSRSVLWFVTVVSAVALSYFFVDRPLCEWVFQHGVLQNRLTRTVAELPALLQFAAFLFLLYLLIDYFSGKMPRPWQRWPLVASVAIVVSVFIKNELKFVFARYWPLTWHAHNPSWIHDHAYGFQWFKSGVAYQSFPSGHAVVLTLVLMLLYLQRPRLRWHALIIYFLSILSLLAMNYHFLSDVIAGSYLGALVALAAYRMDFLSGSARV